MSRNSARSLADIAVAVSRMLQLILERDCDLMPDRDRDAREYFFHSFQGPFDEACYVLEDLGVAHPMPDGKEPSGVSRCFYAFQPDDEMRASIASRSQIEKSLSDRLMSVFLSLACEYAPAGVALSAGREPFRAPCEYNSEITALIELGYLDRSGELVRWSDNISSIMQEVRLWGEPGNLKLPKIPQPKADVQHRIQNLIAQNQRIAAIKLACDEAGMALVDAFDYVVLLEESLPVKSRSDV